MGLMQRNQNPGFMEMDDLRAKVKLALEAGKAASAAGTRRGVTLVCGAFEKC